MDQDSDRGSPTGRISRASSRGGLSGSGGSGRRPRSIPRLTNSSNIQYNEEVENRLIDILEEDESQHSRMVHLEGGDDRKSADPPRESDRDDGNQ